MPALAARSLTPLGEVRMVHVAPLLGAHRLCPAALPRGLDKGANGHLGSTPSPAPSEAGPSEAFATQQLGRTTLVEGDQRRNGPPQALGLSAVVLAPRPPHRLRLAGVVGSHAG